MLLDGFRKVISTEAVNVKMEKDDVEFAHQFFLQGQERLLQFIKRKVLFYFSFSDSLTILMYRRQSRNWKLLPCACVLVACSPFCHYCKTLMYHVIFQVPNLKVGTGGVGGLDDSSLTDARVVLSEMNDVKSRQDNMTVKLENLKLYVSTSLTL